MKIISNWQRLSLALLACLFFAGFARGEEDSFSPVTVKLVSEFASGGGVVPGEKFTLGIYQSMLPGYHTYWKNAGTLGLPTDMKWDLPAGFEAGEIQWALPRVTKMSIYNVWGYEGEALLLVDITAPANLKVGDTITLAGDGVWMCCGDQCYPGTGRLSIKLPVVAKASKRDAKWAAAFDEVRSNQPAKSKRWTLKCYKAGDIYKLLIKPNGVEARDLGDVYFFGFNRQVSSDKGQKLTRHGDTYTLTMTHEEYSPESFDRLAGILVAKNAWRREGESHVLAVDVVIEGK